MSESIKQMVLPFKADVDIEERIKLRLSEMLSFPSDWFCFNYKIKGSQIIVHYNSNEQESILALTRKNQKESRKKIYFIFSLVIMLLLLNLITLWFKESLLIKQLHKRQFVNNHQYHLQQELSSIRQTKQDNRNFLEKITLFLQQPLEINRIYIEDKKFYLDAFVSKTNIFDIEKLLLEKVEIVNVEVEDMGERLWVLIKGS
jgi:hypothetical protein